LNIKEIVAKQMAFIRFLNTKVRAILETKYFKHGSNPDLISINFQFHRKPMLKF
jgi:hypothetical protein